MNTQQQDRYQGGQDEETGNSQKTNTGNSNTGNLVPDDEIKGSDADTDKGLDTSVSPDKGDDENDASGIGSQTKDMA